MQSTHHMKGRVTRGGEGEGGGGRDRRTDTKEEEEEGLKIEREEPACLRCGVSRPALLVVLT